ncbi:MAG: addiction module protein [Actinobacteria bacterium]|nr:addiction module protein [Actinomycetota bacterium]
MNSVREILDIALKMKPADKSLIVEGILRSLDEPDKTIDEIWAVEAERRLQAYKSGNLETVSYKDVFARKQDEQWK